MTNSNSFDTIIIGGSYAGLAAAMALGRALKNVLIIDDGGPCNLQTPYSHNFITHDGETPAAIAALAKQQLSNYDTVKLFTGRAAHGLHVEGGFHIQVASGERFTAKKLVFATGIKDIMQDIEGFAACWGISVLHCPFCHGYEVRNQQTGILGNGTAGFEQARLISNWTNDLTLFTNGAATLTAIQTTALQQNNIKLVEKQVDRLVHTNGQLETIVFYDGAKTDLSVIYAPVPFKQHCKIPEALGCGLTDEGYIIIDAFNETIVKGIYACGDNVSRMRTVANAVAMGTSTGIIVSRQLIAENFQ